MNATRGTVLVVEDSVDLAGLVAELLRGEGFNPIHCPTAAECLTKFDSEHPVAVLLDWTLPDAPGIEVCRQLRAKDRLVPIMFVTGRADEASAARGLEAGADDFVIKPFRQSELMARLESHLRKAATAANGSGAGGETGARNLDFGGFQVDLEARQAFAGGRRLALGALEFSLLEYLCHNVGIAVSREQILTQVYGYNAEIATERVDLLIRRLRAKLGEGVDRGGKIQAVPGYGYRLER